MVHNSGFRLSRSFEMNHSSVRNPLLFFHQRFLVTITRFINKLAVTFETGNITELKSCIQNSILQKVTEFFC
jgi:hypothetical protein